MKKIVLTIGIGLMLGATITKAQTLLDGVVLEKVHIASQTEHDQDVSDGITSPIVTGSITYRLWIDMASGAKLASVWGNNTHALKLETSTTFYNNDNGSSTANALKLTDQTGTNLYDSWVTLGGNSKTTIATYQGANVVKAPAVVTNLGLLLTESFDSYPGKSLLSNGGTFTTLNGEGASGNAYATGTGASNMILIGQFTTDGIFSYELNLQLTNGIISENYAASDTQTGEFTNKTLIGKVGANVAPSITISAPSKATESDIVTINALATDNNIVSKVEFFVDNTAIGSIASAPYTLTWTATIGTHSITAVATDNDNVSTTSAASSIVVSAKPTLTVSSNTVNIVKEGTASSITVTSNVAWSAVAADSWVTVTPSSGTGNGSFTVSATANTGAARTSKITISGAGVSNNEISISQADGTSVTMTLTLSTVTVNLLKEGTASTVTVTSNTDWTASTSDSWITINPTTATKGNGIFTISATANASIARIGTVTIKGTGATNQTISVIQADGIVIPTLTVSATTATLVKEGTAISSISVTAPNIKWIAKSSESWLTITPADSTIGNANLSISATSNIGNTRTATVTISAKNLTSKTITVTQEGVTAFAEVDNVTLTISPNPAKTFISINTNETTQVSVYSLTGEMVLTTSVTGKELLNVSSLPEGVYLVHISNENTNAVQKLIISQ